MNIQEFIKTHGITCGGNWSQMLLSAIKNGLPKVYEKMEDKEWEFEELIKIIKTNI